MNREDHRPSPAPSSARAPPAASAATNKVPAVVYGHGNDPIHLTLPGHETMMALKHGGANALLELDIDGKTQLALTKQVQVDPIRRVLEHVDFVAVRRGEKVTVDIQIHVVGEAVRETLVVTENSTVQVEAEATHIPESIEVVRRGRRGRHPDPRLRTSSCPRAPRCSPTPRRWSSTSPRRSPGPLEEPEAAEAEAGRGATAGESAEARRRRGRRRRGRARGRGASAEARRE